MRSKPRFSSLRVVTGGVYRLLKVLGVLLLALTITACAGSSPQASQTSPTTEPGEFQADAGSETTAAPDSSIVSDGTPGLPADAEAYYKTMVYIEGTAQLMSKFDLAALNNNSTGFISLISIPGLMDDRVIATEHSSLPLDLAPAWEKALEARDGILGAMESLLTASISQDEFNIQIGSISDLASQAVAETEGILASNGTNEESIALAHRAALTEMGEVYQSIASLYVVGQSQNEGESQ
jgi:hypothetical protein